MNTEPEKNGIKYFAKIVKNISAMIVAITGAVVAFIGLSTAIKSTTAGNYQDSDSTLGTEYTTESSTASSTDGGSKTIVDITFNFPNVPLNNPIENYISITLQGQKFNIRLKNDNSIFASEKDVIFLIDCGTITSQSIENSDKMIAVIVHADNNSLIKDTNVYFLNQYNNNIGKYEFSCLDKNIQTQSDGKDFVIYGNFPNSYVAFDDIHVNSYYCVKDTLSDIFVDNTGEYTNSEYTDNNDYNNVDVDEYDSVDYNYLEHFDDYGNSYYIDEYGNRNYNYYSEYTDQYGNSYYIDEYGNRNYNYYSEHIDQYGNSYYIDEHGNMNYNYSEHIDQYGNSYYIDEYGNMNYNYSERIDQYGNSYYIDEYGNMNYNYSERIDQYGNSYYIDEYGNINYINSDHIAKYGDSYYIDEYGNVHYNDSILI